MVRPDPCPGLLNSALLQKAGLGATPIHCQHPSQCCTHVWPFKKPRDLF